MSKTILRGHVIIILNDQKLIINLGFNQGVKPGDRFFIYQEGYEVQDNINNTTLGKIEFIKGEVEAINVQENMTMVMPMTKKNQAGPSSVLSSTLAQTTSSATSATSDVDRERLYVRQDQLTGTTQVTPIAVGDPVRSMFPIET